MKFLLPFLLLSTLLPATGQREVSKILGRGLLAIVAGPSRIAEPDQSFAIDAIADSLTEHITFRPEGTAAATCDATGKDKIEWVGMVVKSIQEQPLTDADELNGITKRYFAKLSCRAHRAWDFKKNFWGEWQHRNHSLFPQGITLLSHGGKITAIPAPELRYFSPAPGPSLSGNQARSKRNALPRGMTAE